MIDPTGGEPHHGHRSLISGRDHVAPFFVTLLPNMRPDIIEAFNLMDPNEAADLVMATYDSALADFADRVQRHFGIKCGVTLRTTKVELPPEPEPESK